MTGKIIATPTSAFEWANRESRFINNLSKKSPALYTFLCLSVMVVGIALMFTPFAVLVGLPMLLAGAAAYGAGRLHKGLTYGKMDTSEFRRSVKTLKEVTKESFGNCVAEETQKAMKRELDQTREQGAGGAATEVNPESKSGPESP